MYKFKKQYLRMNNPGTLIPEAGKKYKSQWNLDCEKKQTNKQTNKPHTRQDTDVQTNRQSSVSHVNII